MTIEEQQKTEATINRTSKITLGLAIFAIAGAGGFGWNASNSLASIKTEQREASVKIQGDTRESTQELKDLIRDGEENSKDLERDVSSNTVKIDAILATRWSLDNESENAARNAIANPGIRYADPKNPGDFFYVQPNTP